MKADGEWVTGVTQTGLYKAARFLSGKPGWAGAAQNGNSFVLRHLQGNSSLWDADSS